LSAVGGRTGGTAFAAPFPSKVANKLMAKASGVKVHDFGTTFKAYRREVLKRIPIYGQMHRFIPGDGKH
jgi:hypothetical protein